MRKYLTSTQVANLFGISPRTANKLYDNGTIQGHRIGAGKYKHRRFLMESVATAMQEAGISGWQEISNHEYCNK